MEKVTYVTHSKILTIFLDNDSLHNEFIVKESNEAITMTIKINEEEKVASVVRQQVQGMVAGDIDILDKVIAPDAHFIHITGTDQTKAEWLQQIKIGRMHYFSSKEKLMQVEVNGDSAKVVSRNELDARIYGFRNTWPLESRTELTKNNGQWQIVLSQASMY